MDAIEQYYSIWLPSLTERKPLIDTLEEKLSKKINIFHAIDGKEHFQDYINHRHILAGQKVTPGMIGCLLSHVEILKTSPYNMYAIFEDDCEFVGNKEELYKFCSDISGFDILCLSTSENVDCVPTRNPSILKITRFWGAHAIVITKKAALAVLETFDSYNKDNLALPGDWLYSYAIKRHNLIAYGPSLANKFFKQKSGLVSTYNGAIRK
jgi:hypothetical protein